MIGETFNRLTVLELLPERNKFCKKMYRCRCSCGKEVVVIGAQVKGGRTKSCGCIKGVAQKKEVYRHHHPMYAVYHGMLQRCYNPKHTFFHYYGGRGIKVCWRWIESFDNFVEDMVERPEGMTLDRLDNNMDYCKENCKWSTWKEQANNRRNNVALRGKVTTL